MKHNRELFPGEVPLACSLSASEQITRGEELVDLFKHVQQMNELPDGYAFRFLGSDLWANRLLEFINYERNCCPFFTFALIFEPKQGPIWLHVRGPEGVKDTIQHMLPPSAGSSSQKGAGT